MSLPVVLWEVAQEEFDEAHDWYEARQSGKGEEFEDAVQAAFARIGAQPRAHALVYKDVRKSMVQGFPYCVYYVEEPQRVSVISVFHTSRDPAIWQGRR